MNKNANPTDFFQAGGSLSPDSLSYVMRQTDNKLLQSLIRNEFCYVFAPRQMGKSSLKLQTISILQKKGFQCINIDLSTIRSHKTNIENWYYNFIFNICKSLNILEKLKKWWAIDQFIEKKNLVEFIYQLIITNFKKNVIIFIDEVDSIINEPFENKVCEFFFQQLELFYKYKKKDNLLNPIGFALFGVTSPYDLTNEMNKEPFKSGRPINLHFLPFSNSKILIKGFAKINFPKTKLLKEIFKWTSGQPYLTLKLCQSIAINEVKILNIESIVHNHVITHFLNESALINDNNLSNVHSRILKSKDLLTNLLSIYSKILNGSKIIYSKSDKSHVYLKLSGLVVIKKGLLCSANRIYESCFNKEWIERINDQKS